MPTLAERLLHSWGCGIPVWLIMLSGNRSSLAWTLSLKAKDVIKRNLVFSCLGEINELERLGTLGHPIDHPSDHSSLG